MRLTVNGQSRDVAATTVAGLIMEMDLPPARLVVELNREIVKREDYSRVALKDGDVLELVEIVGGG